MTTKLGFFEKIANLTGVLYRHQAKQFPRRLDLLTKVAKRELAPPTQADWPIIKKEFANLVKALENKEFRNLTVRETAVYAAVFLEVVFWFFAGEMIGRRNIPGYLVPASYVSKDTKKQVAAQKAEEKDH